MLDLTPIKDYFVGTDSFQQSFIECQINTIGFSKFLDEVYASLDCTRTTNNGMRAMQTIGYPYRKAISEYIFLVDNYVTDFKIKDDLFSKLIERHNANLEFEVLNPPVWYGGDKAKRSFEKAYGKSKTTKKKDKSEIKEKKVTAAERKLAAKVAKINALSFKIKSQN